MIKLGAFWKKEGKTGEYWGGEIEIKGVKTKLIAFPNGYKENEKQPDIIIYLSEPRPEYQKKVEEETVNQEALNEQYPDTEEIDPSSIPF